MKREIAINDTLCRKCKVCVEICPNGIFQTFNNHTSVRSERIDICFMCGQCMAACRRGSVRIYREIPF